jgi:hypothetical protein
MPATCRPSRRASDLACLSRPFHVQIITSTSLLVTPSMPVSMAHFKSYVIPKYSHLLDILALNMLITPINFSLLPSFTLHAPMHGHE